MKTILAVDAMYYTAAQESLARAKKCRPRLDRQRVRYERLQGRFDAIEERARETGERRDDELHDLAIRLESEDYALGACYAPLIQELATVHILCAASLEAHVNARAEQRLPKTLWETFERLPLEAKLLLLPYILGFAPFDPGGEPYQGVARLAKYRNALIHYKPKREDWAPPGVPGFLGTLGLEEDAAERSIEAVRSTIGELAVRLGEDRPYWLNRPGGSFFEVE